MKFTAADKSMLPAFSAAGVLAALLFTGISAAAQVPQVRKTNAGMDLVCNPKVVAPGMTVTIAGSGIPSRASLTITITPPSGKPPSPISAQANPQGAFSTTFARTQVPGKYAVHAESQDHRLKADGSFQVAAGGAGAQEMTQVSQQLFQLCDELLAKIQAILSQLPPAAVPAGVPQQLSQIQAQLGQAQTTWNTSPNSPSSVVKTVEDAIQNDPGAFGAVGQDFSEVEEWNQEGKTLEDRVKKSLGQSTNGQGGGLGSSSSANDSGIPPADEQPECPEKSSEEAGGKTPQSVCEDIHQVTEYLETLETIVTYLGSAKEVAIDVGTKALKAGTAALAKNKPGALSQGAAVGAGAIADQSMTLSKDLWLHEHLEALEEAPEGAGGASNPFPALTDVATMIVKPVAAFVNGHFCGSASGPMAAAMLATATINKRPWWKYRVTLEGTLFLTWAQGRSKIAGDFEGKGDLFKLWEDLISVVYPGAVGLNPALHHCYATFMDRFVGLGILFPGALSEGGCLALNTAWFPSWLGTPGGISSSITKTFSSWGFDLNAALYPDSFKIPVEGEFDEDGQNITLHLQPAKLDFDPVLVRGYVKYVLFMPGPLPVPDEIETALPYKDAHFILARATGDNSQQACQDVPFKLHVSTSGKTQIFSGNFSQSHGGPTGQQGMEGQAEYHLTVRAQSP